MLAAGSPHGGAAEGTTVEPLAPGEAHEPVAAAGAAAGAEGEACAALVHPTSVAGGAQRVEAVAAVGLHWARTEQASQSSPRVCSAAAVARARPS